MQVVAGATPSPIHSIYNLIFATRTVRLMKSYFCQYENMFILVLSSKCSPSFSLILFSLQFVLLVIIACLIIVLYLQALTALCQG